MLPTGLDLGALAGAIAKLAGNGPHRRGIEPDLDIDRPPFIARHDLGLDGCHQPGCDQSAAQIVDFGPLELVAGFEARDSPDMARREGRLAVDPDFAEFRHRPGRDRQHQPRSCLGMIDDDVLLADVGGGEPLLAKRNLERDPGSDHLACDHRIAGLDRKCLAQWPGIPSGFGEPGKLDRLEHESRPRRRPQRDRDNVGLERDPRLDLGIIISLRLEQAGEQFAIGACTTVDLRRIGGLAVRFLERRQVAKRFLQRFVIGRAKPLEPHHIATRRDRIVDRHARVPRLTFRRSDGRTGVRQRRRVGGIHVGPLDSQIRHRVHRSIGVEFGRIGRGLLGMARRAKRQPARGDREQTCRPALPSTNCHRTSPSQRTLTAPVRDDS